MKENTKMEDKAKIERCKYSHPHFKNNSIEYHCVVDGWEDDKVRICKKGECESCQKFKSKYVEYPITVHEIENKPIDTSGLGHEEGSLVAIRPCAKEYNVQRNIMRKLTLEFILEICRSKFLLHIKKVPDSL